MARIDTSTEELLESLARGDTAAWDGLLDGHRDRLRRMVAARMDGRLARRVDPSDIVQEALADASAKLATYLRDRPLPFYAWLRRLACERLIQAHRYHLRSPIRSIDRETPGLMPLPEESALRLLDRLVSSETSPSRRVIRNEQRAQVLAALEQLDFPDREVLVMRYLEELPYGEIAASLGLGLGAVKMRHFRALDRLRAWFPDDRREPE